MFITLLLVTGRTENSEVTSRMDKYSVVIQMITAIFKTAVFKNESKL